MPPPRPAYTTYLLESLNVGTAELQVAVPRDHHSAQRHSWKTEGPFSSWLHVPAACLQAAQQLLTPPCPVLLPLTGLLELLLVIVQSLIVVHADPAHLDPQLLGDWLLTVGWDQRQGPQPGPCLGHQSSAGHKTGC